MTCVVRRGQRHRRVRSKSAHANTAPRGGTCATVASVGMPPGIRRAGAGACATPFEHDRQACFGRRVTMTRVTMTRVTVTEALSDLARWQYGQVEAENGYMTSDEAI